MSFRWQASFRTGQWLALRRFVLEERKDVAARVASIDAELARIGKIIVKYESTTEGNGDITVSEKRVGIWVRQGTSLCKLLQAYIAMGGNPLDISMFAYPDSDHAHQDGTTERRYPGGGVVYIKGGDPLLGGLAEGQHYNLIGDRDARTGTDADLSETALEVVTRIQHARRWTAQAIHHKRNALELRIIKLADCAEQLYNEKEEAIVQAAGGLLQALPEFDTTQFATGLRVDMIVAAMDRVLFEVDEEGLPDYTKPSQTGINTYPSLYADKPEEEWTTL